MSSRRPKPRPARAGPKVFISYRRRFDRATARFLRRDLTEAFGDEAVFRDVDDIAPGDVFPRRIADAVNECDTLLVLISPGWLETIPGLQDPGDFVRIELATALARGDVKVIPLLLDGARMPSQQELPAEVGELALRQARELSDARWDDDIRHLIADISPPRPRPLRKKLSAAARLLYATWPGRAVLAALLVAAVLPFIYPFLFPAPPPDPERPWVYRVEFDPLAGCDVKNSCFWVDTALGGGVRTGTLKGGNMIGGAVALYDTDGNDAANLGITDLKTLAAQVADDHELRFSFRLTRPIPAATGLSFSVSKTVHRGDGEGPSNLVSEKFGYSSPYTQPTPERLGGLSLSGCFDELMPRGRRAAVEYGDPEYRVIVRPEQSPTEAAGVALTTEHEGYLGGIVFRFVPSGKDEAGNDTGFFRIERVIDFDCRPITKYENLTPGRKKDTLANYDYIRVTLRETRYDLRLAYRPDKTIAVRFADRPDY